MDEPIMVYFGSVFSISTLSTHLCSFVNYLDKCIELRDDDAERFQEVVVINEARNSDSVHNPNLSGVLTSIGNGSLGSQDESVCSELYDDGASARLIVLAIHAL